VPAEAVARCMLDQVMLPDRGEVIIESESIK
jgi:hypothetical protein